MDSMMGRGEEGQKEQWGLTRGASIALAKRRCTEPVRDYI